MATAKKPGATLVGFGPEAQEQEALAKAEASKLAHEAAKREREERHKQVKKSTRNRVHKVFMMTPEQADQLDSYCFHGKTTIQATVLEAIDMLYRSKGLPPMKEEILPKS